MLLQGSKGRDPELSSIVKLHDFGLATFLFVADEIQQVEIDIIFFNQLSAGLQASYGENLRDRFCDGGEENCLGLRPLQKIKFGLSYGNNGGAGRDRPDA